MKKFILKRQTVSLAAANPHRPRGQIAYGPLVSVEKFDSLADAQAAVKPGLYRYIVVYAGQRVWEST